MWVKSKRDGGIQLFPDDWEYTAYHMATGLFEEIPDPTVSAPVEPQEPEVVPASDATEPQRPASRQTGPRKPRARSTRRR